MRSRPLYDLLALLARTGVGIVFIAHGWQKIQVGITATSKGFDDLDVPAPTAAAIYATFAELLGGVALILGLALPVVGVLLFLDMAGAFVFVHAGNGLFVVDQGRITNGWELVLILGLASLLFAAGGGGRLTLDNRLFPRHTDTPGEPPPERPEPIGPPTPYEPLSPKATVTLPRPEQAKQRSRWPWKSRGHTESEPPEKDLPPPPEDEPKPRLAADIIAPPDDVRVAGPPKRADGPEKAP